MVVANWESGDAEEAAGITGVGFVRVVPTSLLGCMCQLALLLFARMGRWSTTCCTHEWLIFRVVAFDEGGEGLLRAEDGAAEVDLFDGVV